MPRSLAKDHDTKRRALLKAAARVFADMGYGQASMSAVSAACGISKANIYHYYPSKEALLFGILDTHLRGLRDRLCALAYPSDDAADQLERIMAELLLAYEGADAEHAVQMNAIGALAPPEQEVLRDYQRALVRLVQTRVARLLPDGGQDRTRLRSLTMSVFALVNWFFQWNGHASRQDRLRYAALMRQTLVHGMASAAPVALPNSQDL